MMIMSRLLLHGLLPAVILLGGCAPGQPGAAHPPAPMALAPPMFRELAPQSGSPSEPLLLAEAGVKALSAQDFPAASDKLNLAIKLDPANSGLHFLNGLTYHLRALQGDGSLYELAEEGYKLAVKFDSSNWVARFHQGLLAMDRKDFSAAQNHLAEALLFNRDYPDMLYAMVVASYFAHDPRTAAGALEQLRTREPQSERVLRATCMIEAALGNDVQALASLEQYRSLFGADPRPALGLQQRIGDWQSFYQQARRGAGASASPPARLTPAGYTPAEYATDREAGTPAAPVAADREQYPAGAEMRTEDKMIIVDVVIIQTEENVSTRKGVNLLNGLTVQFGNGNSPAYSWNRDKNQASADTSFVTATAITQALNIPTINYSLNIFNAHTDRAEILARPTVIALNGEESKFFSGLEIEAATVGDTTGNSGGSSVQINKSVGVSLEITPAFQENGRVKLNVHAMRTFLRTPSTDIVYENKIETSKTEVTASVVMNYGESLVLSGLSEKETERIRDGVPLLQDLPLVQYLFSRKDSRDFQRSVLILLTPRLPQYVYRDNGRQPYAAGNVAGTPLDELQARYSDWFKPYPNWASVFHHMQSNSLYREFRTGDVTMEKWENQQSLLERLKQAFLFLYF